MSEALLVQLAERLARPIGPGERTRARWHLLDWLACVAGGRNSDAAKVAKAISAAGWERATYLGNVLEMDDVHRIALLHPGPVVWPAAMSMPQASLEQRLSSAIRGYEAMIAIGGAMDAYHYAHWHPTASMGVFGACASYASLLDLGREPLVDALGNAGSVAGGFWHMRHAPQALTKQWHIYHAVRTGCEAARHAAHGAAGPRALLEGQQGLFAAMTREPAALADPGAGWLIEEVSFKPWAACRHAHPAIDAALRLRAAGKLAPPFIVETYADALSFCDRPQPQTPIEARFSLQHAVALVAAGRNVEAQDFTLEAIVELADLREQVVVREDPAITARYPAHFGARVNGYEILDTLGDPERPIALDDLVAKMHSLARWGGLGKQAADRAIALALEQEDAAALDALVEEWTR